MSDRPAPDGGVIAGILTGALIGVTVAMALAPVKTGTKRPGEMLARGRSILDAASAGLGSEPGPDLSPSSPGA